MTLSPPGLPQYIIRGKSLSPESPVPVHVPEPQNIPVLQNQIDPEFNLLPSHMESSSELVAHDVSPHSTGSPHATAAEPSVPQGLGQENSTHVRAIEGSESLVHEDAPSKPSAPETSTVAIAASQEEHPPQNSDDIAGKAHIDPPTIPQAQSSTDGSKPSIPTSEAGRKVQMSHQSPFVDEDEGVNYQALLDNLTPSIPVPTANEAHPAATASSVPAKPPVVSPNAHAVVTAPSGLPARPPGQDISASSDASSAPNFISIQSQSGIASSSRDSQNQSTNMFPAQSGPAPNGMEPPPLATFQQITASDSFAQDETKYTHGENSVTPSHPLYPGQSAGTASHSDVESEYQDFLRFEASNTSSGLWERFPPGSRLFVGNLFTERVNKRDIFLIFHKYGRLAQISMKSAYGFVQFVTAEDCRQAMQSEQGIEIKGRKINLEVSKPQKNTRNAAGAGGDGGRRRSRSPESRRGTKGGRSDRSNQARGRDDYRPARSPSPRDFRNRDGYRGGRDRSSDRYHGSRRSRSRSPYGGSSSYRDRSPRSREIENEADLPVARRQPGSAPDVEIIIAEDVDRAFIDYIQQAFRDRSLRCEAVQLPPRVAMPAMVLRQVLEGVLAVIQIFRKSQVNGKVPLQIYKRTPGSSIVNFEDYEDLDAPVVAEIVSRVKTAALSAPAPSQYPPPQGFPSSPYGQQFPNMAPQQASQSNVGQSSGPPSANQLGNVQNLIGALDAPSLQKLLTSMAQNPQMAQNALPNQAGQNPDLSALLAGVQNRPQGAQQPPPQYGQQQQAPQGPGYRPFEGPSHQYSQNMPPGPGGPQMAGLANNPAFSHLLMNSGNRPPQGGQPSQQQQANVQDIMAQLTRYK